MDDQILLTPSALLDFLAHMDEFKDKAVGVAELPDGNIQVTVGDSQYVIDCSNAENVSVDDKAVEQVADINEDAYVEIAEAFGDSGKSIGVQDVEGGLISEIAKTLAIGGLARLAGKATKSMLS